VWGVQRRPGRKGGGGGAHAHLGGRMEFRMSSVWVSLLSTGGRGLPGAGGRLPLEPFAFPLPTRAGLSYFTRLWDCMAWSGVTLVVFFSPPHTR
jgi:hypothetical protein